MRYVIYGMIKYVMKQFRRKKMSKGYNENLLFRKWL